MHNHGCAQPWLRTTLVAHNLRRAQPGDDDPENARSDAGCAEPSWQENLLCAQPSLPTTFFAHSRACEIIMNSNNK